MGQVKPRTGLFNPAQPDIRRHICLRALPHKENTDNRKIRRNPHQNFETQSQSRRVAVCKTRQSPWLYYLVAILVVSGTVTSKSAHIAGCLTCWLSTTPGLGNMWYV